MQREGEGGSKEAAVEVTVKKTNRRKEVEEDTPPPLDVGEHPRSQSSFELGHPADINPLRLEFQANEGTAALPTEPAAKKEQHPPHPKKGRKGGKKKKHHHESRSQATTPDSAHAHAPSLFNAYAYHHHHHHPPPQFLYPPPPPQAYMPFQPLASFHQSPFL